MNTLQSYIDELSLLKEEGLYRSLKIISGEQKERVVINGKEMLLFCSNNYLGLANHSALKNASTTAVNALGSSSGASRLVSGTMEIHHQLEEKIAEFKQKKSAILFNSGYDANTGAISALVGRGDVIFSDKINHASILDGALLSRAELVRYPHNDMNALESLLKKKRGKGKALIVTDGVFSMDGDIAPLKELAELKDRFGAILMVDDAHATGIMGENGRGSSFAASVQDRVDVQMGTFGKALGSFGAYIAADNVITEYLVNRSRSFIFSTSLPPSVLAASIAALEIILSNEGDILRKRLEENRKVFVSRLQSAGLDTSGSVTQIVPVIVGDPKLTMKWSSILFEKGVFAQGIRPPTVPRGGCRLRCTLMASHTMEDIEFAADAIINAGRELGLI